MTTPSVCLKCGSELGPASKICPGCGWLVHGDRLKELSESARRATAENQLTEALADWRAALELLPPETRQYEVVRTEASRLSDQIAATPTAQLRQSTTSKLKTGKSLGEKASQPAGLFGTIMIVLMKFKTAIFLTLSKGKLLLLGATKWSTLWTMLLSLSVYGSAWGWKLAAGLVLAIYIHEMGHVFMMHRYGLALSAPLFIPGLGAFVQMRQHPVNPTEDARIGLAGPVWGLACALLTEVLYRATGTMFWSGLTRILAWITLFNLMPVWQLDGSRAFRAFRMNARGLLIVMMGLLWAWMNEGLLLLLGFIAFLRLQEAGPAKTDRQAWFQYVGVLLISCLLVKWNPAHP